MVDRGRIAARLRLVADQIEAGTPEEEAMKRELLDTIKKQIVRIVKDNPAYRDRDPEEIWNRIAPALKVEVKKVLSADAG